MPGPLRSDMFYVSIYFLTCPHCYIYLLFLACGVFAAARGLSLVAVPGASHRNGFSCCGAQALGMRASVTVVRGLSCCSPCA